MAPVAATALPLISIVVPCYNESAAFGALRAALAGLADELAPRYRCELVLVDDGSADDTWAQISAFAAADARVRGFRLSRNFGHQAAVSCGYDFAVGDAVVCLDADLQDPPAVIPQMLACWEQGADIVLGVRIARAGETWFKRVSASLFYRGFRWMTRSPAALDAGDFRLLSRRSLDAFRTLREAHRFLRGMVGWMGYRVATVAYERHARSAGTTKYPLLKMVRLAADAMVSFSSFPLRLSYWFAFGGGLVVLGFLVYSFIRWLFFHEMLVRGWTSTMMAIAIFGGATLLCLGIIGEYVGRIYEQVKQRPIYLVSDLAGAPASRRQAGE